jgi:hypothetical protein
MVPREERMSPQDMKMMVIGPNVWGKGDTLDEALEKAGRPKQYIAYIVHKDTMFDVYGRFHYIDGQEPKEVFRKEPRKKRVK